MSRPSTAEILVAYLRHAEVGEREGQSHVSSYEVEQRFGLHDLVAEDYFQELLRYDLVREFQAVGVGHLYRLGPRGRGLLEGIPSLEQAVQALVGASGKPGLFEKLRDEGLREALKLGASEAVRRLAELLRLLSS